ncbi:MAG: FKBP-type peptidyl-prolyl cis-trans isomerase [Armatimonadetes bacterium]|nr:FKBP-type peptidyl-prolyl cis-trans isomerase [Armatimonadota bacterium]
MPTVTTASGLQYQELVVGTGAEATTGKKVFVNYIGTFTDGRQFEAGNFDAAGGIAIGVGQLVPGFDEGVLGMKVGGKRKLFLTSALAYGVNGSPRNPQTGEQTIPPNTPINFEVELTNVQ